MRIRCRRFAGRARASAAVFAAGSLLCGCADLARAVSAGDAGVNVESPVAPMALEASHGRYAYPSFARVPPAPKDVRSATAFKGEVATKATQRRALEAWTAANPPMTSNVDAFVTQTRRRALEAGAAPIGDETAAAEAFAAKLRAAAAPPPPAK